MRFSNVKFLAIAAVAIAVMVLAPDVLAAPQGVSGSLSTGVTGNETLAISATEISFLPVTDPNVTINTTFLKDNGLPVVASQGHVTSVPIPASFPIDQFLTLDGTPIDFILNGVGSVTATGITAPGSSNGSNCAGLGLGESCVISGSLPYLLIAVGPTATEVVLPLNGWVTDTAPIIVGGAVTNGNPFFGAFSTNIPQSAGAIQAQVLGGGSIGCGMNIGCAESSELTINVVTPNPITSDSPFLIRYASNLNIADSYVDITNSGANGAPPGGPGFGTPAGNICANVYTFSPDEQLVSCCSCNLTPNALASLSVVNDLISNTLTGVRPNSVVIKIVSTLNGAGGSGTNCTNTAGGPIALADIVPGLAAWGTTLHLNGSTAAFDLTETRFIPGTLSQAELDSITGRCRNIIGNGSSFGICRSCRAGGLGATKQ